MKTADKAEDEERRLDLEQKKREQQKEKERSAELKAEEKRIKGMLESKSMLIQNANKP